MISKEILWQVREIKADPGGRWIIAKGDCYGKRITLGTVYAPNENQVEFIEKTLVTMLDSAEGPIIIGGDFNLVLQPELDSSSRRSVIPGKRLRRLRK